MRVMHLSTKQMALQRLTHSLSDFCYGAIFGRCKIKSKHLALGPRTAAYSPEDFLVDVCSSIQRKSYVAVED